MGIKRQQRVAQAKQKDLLSRFEQGEILSSSSDVPEKEGISQIVFIQKLPDNRYKVFYEYFYPTQWDHTIEESEYFFDDQQKAWDWIKEKFQLEFYQFHLVNKNS